MNFQQRVKLAIKEENKIYKKAGIKKILIVNFPTKQKVSFLVKIAMWILRVSGGILDTRYFDIKNKK